MFEREIQFIYDFSHNKIKSLGSFITYSQLKSTDLHPAILQYISAEIDFYIFEDRQKLLKDSLFDYSGKKINSYFMLISEEIKKTKKFSLSYIEKLILHSVTFTINHLVSPNSLTSQFIFEEDNEKSASEVKQILNYLYYYPYIKKIISAYLDKKNILKISSEEFKELLKKIDNIGFAENPGKIYQEALESMADFLNIGMSGRTMVPLIAVQNYLKDKNLNAHLDKLKSEFVDAEITRYEIKDYLKLFAGIEPSVLQPADTADTEEVLESDLGKNAEQPPSFEPVNEDEETTVDLKIKDGDSPKVILDEETVEDTDNDSGKQKDSNSEQKADAARVDDKDTGSESESEDKIAKVKTDEKTAGKQESEIEIIDIDDERGLEGETVAEVMELAKEEKNITTDEDLEGKELIPEEDDDSLGIIDDIREEAAVLDKDRKDESKVTGKPADNEEQTEDRDSPQDNKPPLGFQVASDDKKEAMDEDSKHISPEVPDNESDTDRNDTIADDAVTGKGDEEPTEGKSDSKDTLSYLLNDDGIEDEKDDNSSAKEEPENVIDEAKSEKDPGLFENDKENRAEEEMKNRAEEERKNRAELDRKKKAEAERKNIEKPTEPKASHIDITSLLENKKITKVIDAIFDYDMEEFANTIELIGEATSLGSANQIIDNVCSASQISTSSKEVKLFKSIISDYYDRK